MLKAIINDKNSFEIEEKNDLMTLNGAEFDWDISGKDGQFHIIHKHKSYNAELVAADFVSKKLQIKINGKNYSIEIKDKLDILLEKLGMNQLASSAITDIKAPMPGLILEILIKEGTEVKKGDPIMILEAMKMENILKSPGDGVVKKIVVEKGDSVEKNQILINFRG